MKNHTKPIIKLHILWTITIFLLIFIQAMLGQDDDYCSTGQDHTPDGLHKIGSVYQRPSLNGELTILTTNFKIHYTLSDTNASSHALAESVAVYAEWSRSAIINLGGWELPPPDGANGGDSLLDIYIYKIDARGFNEKETAYPTPYPYGTTSWIAIKNNLLPSTACRVVLHEYHHACQQRYREYESNNLWFMENTSVYITGILIDDFDDIGDRLSVGPPNPINNPELPINHFAYPYQYAGGMWPLFLHKCYGNAAVRFIWEQIGIQQINDVLLAINTSLINDFSSTIETALQQYAIWRYFTGSRADNYHFDYNKANLWPEAPVYEMHSSYPITNAYGTSLQGQGCTSYIEFNPTPNSMYLNVSFDGYSDIVWRTSVIGYRNPSQSTVEQMTLNSNGIGTSSVPWPGNERIVLIPVATFWSGGGANYSYMYSATITEGVSVTIANKVNNIIDNNSTLTIDSQTVTSGTQILLADGYTYLGKTNHERLQGNNKHKDWDGQAAQFHLQENFPAKESYPYRVANFISLNPVTITTSLSEEGCTSGGTIEFKDPWYLADASGNQPYQFFPYSVPFHPTGAYNQSLGGLFLDQRVQDSVYYTVRALFVPLPGFIWTFIGWKGENTIVQNPGLYETPVVFTALNATLTARYKAHMAASTPISYSNQRKIVKMNDWDNYYDMVHESSGEIFHSFSTDGGTTWSLEEYLPGKFVSKEYLLSDSTGNSSNPSVTHNYLPPIIWHETIVVWEEKIAGGNGYRIMMRNGDWSGGIPRMINFQPSSILYENATAYPTAATPMISLHTACWKDPAGIMCVDVYGGTPYFVAGTNANSYRPSIGGIYAPGGIIVWQQDGVGIQYKRNSDNGTPPITIASNNASVLNVSPTIVRNTSGMALHPYAYIAWEERDVATSQASLKCRSIYYDGALSPVSTIYSCPLASAELSPTLNYSLHSNDTTISIVWSIATDGVGFAINKNGNWSLPYKSSKTGQFASIGKNDDLYSGGQPLAVSKAVAGPPYRLQVDTLPIASAQYNLTLNAAAFIGTGSGGSYNVNDMSTGESVCGTIIGGYPLKLEAVAPYGWAFYKWSDSVAENPRTLTPTGNITLNAVYTGHLSVSGTISSSATWSVPIVDIVGDITVVSGATLTINAGSTIRVRDDYDDDGSIISTNMNVNGKLIINGTDEQPVTIKAINGGRWGSIVLNGAGTDHSIIEYANIQNGTEIAALNVHNYGLTVSTCTLTNMINGVRYYNAWGWVMDTKIINPLSNGILVTDGSVVACYRNDITTTYPSNFGIYYGGGSYDYVLANKISGFCNGLAARWGSYPILGHPTGNDGRNNHITNCTWGLNIYMESNPSIGWPLEWDESAWTYGNNVYNNSQWAAWIADCPDEYIIYAQNVYWGTTDPLVLPSLFHLSNVYYFDYTNPLSSCTWDGQQRVATIPECEPHVLSLSKTVGNGQAEKKDMLIAGIKLRLQGKHGEAVKYFKSIIEQHPKETGAYIELYKTINDTTSNDIKNFFSSLSKDAPPIAKLLLSNIYLRNGNVESAKQVNNNLIRTYLKNEKMTCTLPECHVYSEHYGTTRRTI